MADPPYESQASPIRVSRLYKTGARPDELRKMKADAVAALDVLAERARENLAWPTPELMKQVFDLLDTRVLVGANGLQLTGTIPIGAWDQSDVAVGELRSGVPPDPLSNLPWSEMRIPTAIRVTLPVSSRGAS